MSLVPHHPRNVEPQLDPHLHGKVRAGALWVVTAISNPARYKTRFALYRQFRRHVLEELQLPLVTVECALNDSDFHATPFKCQDDRTVVEGTHPNGTRFIDVRLRNKSWVWLKECLQNIGAAHVPADAEAVLFCDADIEFHNKHIATEIMHALQTHRVVQPFEHAVDLGPRGEVMQLHESFFSCYRKGMRWKLEKCFDKNGLPMYYHKNKGGVGNAWHPGYCMAWRLSTLQKIQLLEVGVLGAGDMHMAAALIGKCHLSYPQKISQAYKDIVHKWQDRADWAVQRDVGVVHGTISHHWHGKKSNRKYIQRWSVLIDNDYDPERDVFKNAQGVLEVRVDRWGLRDGIRRYLQQREEDSVDTE